MTRVLKIEMCFSVLLDGCQFWHILSHAPVVLGSLLVLGFMSLYSEKTKINQLPNPLNNEWARRWSGSRWHVYTGVTGFLCVCVCVTEQGCTMHFCKELLQRDTQEHPCRYLQVRLCVQHKNNFVYSNTAWIKVCSWLLKLVFTIKVNFKVAQLVCWLKYPQIWALGLELPEGRVLSLIHFSTSHSEINLWFLIWLRSRIKVGFQG